MSDVMLDPAWPDPPPEGFRHDAGDPDEAFPVPFSAFDALAMVIWTIVAQVIVVGIAIGMGVLSGDPDVDPIATTGLTVQIVAQVLTLLGMVVYLRGRGVLSWRILGPIRPRWSHVGIGMGLGVGVPSLLGSSCGASAARRRRGLKTQAEFLEDSSRVPEKIASIK